MHNRNIFMYYLPINFKYTTKIYLKTNKKLLCITYLTFILYLIEKVGKTEMQKG